MKKVIIFIGRLGRLVSILILIAIGMIQGSIFLEEISGGLMPLLKAGEIWRFIFQCELLLLLLLAVLFSVFLFSFFVVVSIFARKDGMSRDIWLRLFWTYNLFKN